MEDQQSPKSASPSSSGRSSSASPEFEFWMIRNPSFPQPHQLSADQLFSHGVLLPLQLLPQIPTPQTPTTQILRRRPPRPPAPPAPAPAPAPAPSKRWTNIFKIPTNKEAETNNNKEKKQKQRKSGTGGAGAELNINIWPFSRSHSAGSTGSTRPSRLGGGANRKVSSAPCSRSNSAGESKSRTKWPSSPGRAAGIHVGRTSPVWQVRPRGSRSEPALRGGKRAAAAAVSASASVDAKEKESLTGLTGLTSLTGLTGKNEVSAASRGGGKSKVLKGLNVPTCIGYRQQLSCRSEEETLLGGGGGGRRGVAGGGGGGGDGGGGGGGGKLFNLRTLFTKKVY